jgi:hypothetical protein
MSDLGASYSFELYMWPFQIICLGGVKTVSEETRFPNGEIQGSVLCHSSTLPTSEPRSAFALLISSPQDP